MINKLVLILTVSICSILNLAISEKPSIEYYSQDLEVFLELPFTIADEIATRRILEDVLSKDLDQLLENPNIISKARDRLEKIPPLRLIAFILSDFNLRESIKLIEYTDIRLHFLLGWLDLLLNNSKDSCLFAQQLSGFSEFLSLDKNVVQNYENKQSFRELFRDLLYSAH